MIPFNRPPSFEATTRHLAEVAASGHHSGDGPMTRRATAALRELFPGAAAVLLTTSCTHALELAALVLGVGPGDEVVLPSFTFVSTANAFALRGARVRFADIREDTLCIDPQSVEELLGPRTKAIVPVHYAGIACDMAALLQQAERVGAHVVEDNAHGLFGRHAGRSLGSFGAMSTLSFHETKNVSAGEGGALVVNDQGLAAAAEIAREKGTNRSQFLRGMVDKYTWVGLGSSWLPSDFTAAVLLASLENAPSTQERRTAVWNAYATELADWAAVQGVRLPYVPAESSHPAHIFHLLLPDLDARTRLIDHLRAEGVQAVFHYVPLHSSPYVARDDRSASAPCRVSTDVSDRLVRLPLYPDLDKASVERIIASVLSFRC